MFSSRFNRPHGQYVDDRGQPWSQIACGATSLTVADYGLHGAGRAKNTAPGMHPGADRQRAPYDPSMRGPAPLQRVPTPSPAEVQKYLAQWHAGNNEKLDVALRTLFEEVMPNNTDFGEVAVKAAALNELYKTGILAVVEVATHIVELGIDARLAEDTVDADLIEAIATVVIGGNRRHNYVFATKYCSFHRPNLYPIYDSLVAGVLNTLLQQGETFDSFGPDEHWRTDPPSCGSISHNYAIWCRSIAKFRTHYGLEAFSIRDIDKYLWMLAKERQAKSATSALHV